MKKIALAFGSSIACLFLLAACADTSTPTPVSPLSQNTNSSTIKNDQQTSLTIGSSSEETQNQESTLKEPSMVFSTMETSIPANEEPNPADQKAFDQAVAGSNESECNALKDPKAKILCQSKVSNSRSNEEVKGTTQQ
jgi:ABC-type uncharacterized transport system auxiliary subunit